MRLNRILGKLNPKKKSKVNYGRGISKTVGERTKKLASSFTPQKVVKSAFRSIGRQVANEVPEMAAIGASLNDFLKDVKKNSIEREKAEKTTTPKQQNTVGHDPEVVPLLKQILSAVLVVNESVKQLKPAENQGFEQIKTGLATLVDINGKSLSLMRDQIKTEKFNAQKEAAMVQPVQQEQVQKEKEEKENPFLKWLPLILSSIVGIGTTLAGAVTTAMAAVTTAIVALAPAIIGAISAALAGLMTLIGGLPVAITAGLAGGVGFGLGQYGMEKLNDVTTKFTGDEDWLGKKLDRIVNGKKNTLRPTEKLLGNEKAREIMSNPKLMPWEDIKKNQELMDSTKEKLGPIQPQEQMLNPKLMPWDDIKNNDIELKNVPDTIQSNSVKTETNNYNLKPRPTETSNAQNIIDRQKIINNYEMIKGTVAAPVGGNTVVNAPTTNVQNTTVTTNPILTRNPSGLVISRVGHIGY